MQCAIAPWAVVMSERMPHLTGVMSVRMACQDGVMSGRRGWDMDRL